MKPNLTMIAGALVKRRLGLLWPSANDATWREAEKDARAVLAAIEAAQPKRRRKRKRA